MSVTPAGRRRHIVVLFIAVQVALPGTMLAARWIAEGSRPSTEYVLSFQMYSTVRDGQLVGRTEGGQEIALDVDALPPFKRAMTFGGVVERLLCDENEALVEVQRVGSNGESEAVKC